MASLLDSIVSPEEIREQAEIVDKELMALREAGKDPFTLYRIENPLDDEYEGDPDAPF